MPAFPGAQGFAANTRGAAGYSGTPTVRKVTSLDDITDRGHVDYPGTLRWAIEGDGSANDRDGTFVVFDVSGIIELISDLRFRSDYMTVLGQTSPNGINIAGYIVDIGYGNVSSTEHYGHIIVRYLRFRAGNGVTGLVTTGGSDPDMECLRIWNAHNVFIDHCSMAYAGDETFSITDWNGTTVDGTYNITVNKCIISDPITDAQPSESFPHNLGILAQFRYDHTNKNSINIHKCYFSNCAYRTPYIAIGSGSGATGDAQVSNCAVWNWNGGLGAVGFQIYETGLSTGDLKLSAEGNVARAGGNSNAFYPTLTGDQSGDSNFSSSEVRAFRSDDNATVIPDASLYVAGNMGAARSANTDPEWCVVASEYSSPLLLDSAKQRLTPWTFPGVAVTVEDVGATTAAAYSWVSNTLLADIGANRVAGSGYLGDDVQDQHDTDAINAWGVTSNFVDAADLTWPTDWDDPATGAPSAWPDTGSTGLADAYETSIGETVGTVDPVADSGDGYLHIEKWSHTLAGDSAPAPSAPTVTTTTLSPNENQNVAGTVLASESPTSFAIVGGADQGLLSINSSGVVTLDTGNFDYETKTTYVIDVTATNATGTSASQTVTINVADLDEVAPVITLVGGNVSINVGDTYNEPGYSATDNVDGNITGNVSVGGSVDTNTAGVYQLTYDVSDAAGNAATQQTRQVTVNALAATITIGTATGDNGGLAAIKLS